MTEPKKSFADVLPAFSPPSPAGPRPLSAAELKAVFSEISNEPLSTLELEAVLKAMAKASNIDAKAVLRAIRGNTPLARVVRAMFTATDENTAKGGRATFHMVEGFRDVGLTIKEACKRTQIALSRSGHSMSADSILRAYKRARAVRKLESPLASLYDLPRARTRKPRGRAEG